MGKVRYFAIVFHNDKTVYHPGEQVTGQCLLELKSDMKMRALHMFMRGVAKVRCVFIMRPLPTVGSEDIMVLGRLVVPQL